MKNAIWLTSLVLVIGGVFYQATKSVKPLADAPPAEVKIHIETTVEVDPDGVARMVSTTEFREPEVLVGLLHNQALDREMRLRSLFEESIREGLVEQPWETGEVELEFDLEDPEIFRVYSDVLLYRYAWVEEAADELWYSPGTITRQDGLVELVSVLEMFGQEVARIDLESEGIAYWPAGSVITETLPVPGTYHGEKDGLRIDYRLDVYEDEATNRPIVHSRFNLHAPNHDELLADLGAAFSDLLQRVGVPEATRNVYIRYHYPVPEEPQLARAFDAAPARGRSILFLAVALALVGMAWVYMKKEVYS